MQVCKYYSTSGTRDPECHTLKSRKFNIYECYFTADWCFIVANKCKYASITVPLVLQYLREFDAPALQS